jgi:hypothetical protein
MQLEHCPFCGTSHSLLPDASGRYQQIVCVACGARGPEVYRNLPYKVAVESWNLRQGPCEVNQSHRPYGAMPVGVPPTELPQRYDYGYAGRIEGMHQRKDGKYVKWDDVKHAFGVNGSDACKS